MAYLLSNICTKNYWNRTTIVEIILGGWAVSFFETQCSSARPIQTSEMTLRFSVVRQRGFLRTTYPLGELVVHHEVVYKLLVAGQLEFMR